LGVEGKDVRGLGGFLREVGAGVGVAREVVLRVTIKRTRSGFQGPELQLERERVWVLFIGVHLLLT
jgi:hypothetical protein